MTWEPDNRDNSMLSSSAADIAPPLPWRAVSYDDNRGSFELRHCKFWRNGEFFAAKMAEQMVSSYAGRFTLTDEEESDLEEIFQQCIEIQGGEASLSELSMMFCRSRFAERSSLFLDCYNEFLEVWQLARPLHLRRYFLNHRKSFVVSGVNVRCHVEPKIPTELLEAVWYLKDFILDKFSGVVKVPSLVRALLNEGAFVHSGLRRIVGETDDEVRRFLNACFSVFKIHRKTDIIYVIGSKSTLADPVAANAIDKMLKQLRIRPCKISELVATDTEDVLLNFNSLYAFVVSFPFVFEVKKGSDGLDAIVFAMERHEDELYKALDEISQGREVSSATVKDCFQMFVRCLSKNGGSVDLSSEIDLLEAVFQDSRLTAFLSPKREDLVTFLSLFSPPFFTIEQGKVALVENPETIGVPGFSKLAKEAISYADKVKENWKVEETHYYSVQALKAPAKRGHIAATTWHVCSIYDVTRPWQNAATLLRAARGHKKCFWNFSNTFFMSATNVARVAILLPQCVLVLPAPKQSGVGGHFSA